MVDALKNLATSTVATAPSPATSGTSLVVAAGTGTRYPAVPFDVTLYSPGTRPDPTNCEIARCTNVSTDTLTLTRAQYGTTAQSVAIGWYVDNDVTANLLGQLMATATYDPAAIAQQVVGTTATQTLTNKRITKRVLALSANSATPAINSDSYDAVEITSQTTAITSFTSGWTGTPNLDDMLLIAITGTAAVALTWGAKFIATTIALPTTTVGTTRLRVLFMYSTAASAWECVGVA